MRYGPSDDLMSWLTIGLAVAAVWRSSVIHSWVPKPPEASQHDGHCLRCEYDLSGLTLTNGAGTCPECGAGFLSPELPPSWPEAPQSREMLTTRLMPMRGFAAFFVVFAATLLPRALTDLITSLMTYFDSPGMAANLWRSYAMSSEYHPIMRSGAACAMCVAMLLSWRIPMHWWFSRVMLALALWLGVCAWNLPTSSWAYGSLWRLTFDREAAPLLGAAAGLASVGIHIALSHARRFMAPRGRTLKLDHP
ncbi:MAG: hypothetical protein K2X32_03790 [Phycisphaerales bacterium]|nr:hypothetical protein [Phycisphaerales bacterium]